MTNVGRLKVAFILARRFTLCAYANFVDVLRLAADEGDRSRPILCSWKIVAADREPIVSSCGVAVQAEEPLGDPSRFDYVVVVGGLVERSRSCIPTRRASSNGPARRVCRWSASAPAPSSCIAPG
ncbi:hypothetical protein [Amaricoccus sp. W119]|uniref:hypothetical protein n=1 Tax=Amaricoccus sp. W119 TaxID=3391833 RepID=UPI0039A5F63A